MLAAKDDLFYSVESYKKDLLELVLNRLVPAELHNYIEYADERAYLCISVVDSVTSIVPHLIVQYGVQDETGRHCVGRLCAGWRSNRLSGIHDISHMNKPCGWTVFMEGMNSYLELPAVNYPEALESFINGRLSQELSESSLQFADERNFLFMDITTGEASPVLLLQFGIHDGDRRRVMGILKAEWLHGRIGRIQGMLLEGKPCSWPQLWGLLDLYLDLPLDIPA